MGAVLRCWRFPSWLLRAKYLTPTIGLNKIQGKPFLISDILTEIERLIVAPINAKPAA